MIALLIAAALAAEPEETRAVFTFNGVTGDPVWDALECRRVYLVIRLH
jgi:hypothetical protein